ncbi:hypothetical protein G9H64_12885 [Aquirufa nivalisilvae]|uniref:HEPN AbiJ-N-terminal domain-containing protein n=1 Tax=Aquirufa nivalisilvae TaxID=2516557 RepID=A0A2S2DWP2_9BACT|nr:hypothetical protein [Aquirufa nivalisilvae]AWL09712.1 hypothetical protein HME7025_01861 [Aquirufa nivalisilvae]MCZ2483857.1 hypothetical protein [Aquirufa nivalisilvae]
MKFSQRLGKASSVKQLQIDSIDDDLKNGLWNAITIFIINNHIEANNLGHYNQFDDLCKNMWHNFYKLPIDTIPHYDSLKTKFIRDSFFQGDWLNVYEHIEFLANIRFIDSNRFMEFCNVIFEREFSGYRFIDGLISPITNESEIEEIEMSIQNSGHFTSLKGVNIHLKSALEKLSDRKSPDYRNSIKESISAIESVAKVISENEKDSLGSALDKIKGKIKLHSALERGFKQLYGYTSDSDGIRHALMENPNCDFEDAKYMLVSSSAFINYLIVKAGKAGITFI